MEQQPPRQTAPTDKKTPDRAREAIEALMPRLRRAGALAVAATVLASERMDEAGARLGAAAPDLAKICVVQTAYALALGVLSVATGSSGIAALIVSQLPLVVYVAARMIRAREK
jgi:hypothetical protein